jgi:hypothetical protein
VLRGRRLEKDSVDLELDVARKEVIEDRLRLRLVEVVDPRSLVLGRGLDRKHPLDDRLLRDHGAELVVDDVDRVDLLFPVVGDDRLRELARGVERERLEDVHRLHPDVRLAAPEEVIALPADGKEAGRDPVALRERLLGELDRVHVEAAAEPLVRGDDDDEDVLLLATLE